MKSLFLSIFALLPGIAAASGINVQTPANSSQLTSPFNLVASATSCDSVPAVSMGYSIDYGKSTIVSTNFSAMVIAGEGQHILHVKCWGARGAAGVEDLNIEVVAPPPPPKITVVSDLQSLPQWEWKHDTGTPGEASGGSATATSPSLSGNARQFEMSFTGAGGELFHISFGSDVGATHFVYDAEVWLSDPSSLANIELDMNQVIANGDTVIYGVQCDGYSRTWDYTVNKGTPAAPKDTWIHSNAACPEPRTWEPNAWHHVELSYSRDAAGNVTYDSVVLDGHQTDFVGATGNSAFKLGWSPTLLANFQLDGFGSDGAVTAYLDKVSISRW